MDPRKLTAKRKRSGDRIPSRSLDITLLIIKAVFWAAVAGGLFIVWFFEYMKPILQKENELARIENEILRFTAERQLQANEVARDSLMRSLALADSLRETYRLRLVDMDSRLTHLSLQYERLSADLHLSDVQRSTYKQYADSMIVERDSLRSALEQQKKQVIVKKQGGAWGGSGPWGGGRWGE